MREFNRGYANCAPLPARARLLQRRCAAANPFLALPPGLSAAFVAARGPGDVWTACRAICAHDHMRGVRWDPGAYLDGSILAGWEVDFEAFRALAGEAFDGALAARQIERHGDAADAADAVAP